MNLTTMQVKNALETYGKRQQARTGSATKLGRIIRGIESCTFKLAWLYLVQAYCL